jgi:hypothetical protein
MRNFTGRVALHELRRILLHGPIHIEKPYLDIRGSKESEFLLVMSQKVLVICEPKHFETMQNKARVRTIKPVQ